MTTMSTTTKAVAAVTLAAGLSIAGVASAGTASADQDKYISRLKMNSSPLNGEITNMDAFVYSGEQVCEEWNGSKVAMYGWDRARAVDLVYHNLGPADVQDPGDALHGVDYEEAEFIVDQAIGYLC
jgi:hypothetical protein